MNKKTCLIILQVLSIGLLQASEHKRVSMFSYLSLCSNNQKQIIPQAPTQFVPRENIDQIYFVHHQQMPISEKESSINSAERSERSINEEKKFQMLHAYSKDSTSKADFHLQQYTQAESLPRLGSASYNRRYSLISEGKRFNKTS